LLNFEDRKQRSAVSGSAPKQFFYKDKEHVIIVVGSKDEVKDLFEGLPWVIKLLADCKAIDTTALPQ
jgi:hypothetical protein